MTQALSVLLQMRDLVRDMLDYMSGGYCDRCDAARACAAKDQASKDCLVRATFASRARDLGIRV